MRVPQERHHYWRGRAHLASHRPEHGRQEHDSQADMFISDHVTGRLPGAVQQRDSDAGRQDFYESGRAGQYDRGQVDFSRRIRRNQSNLEARHREQSVSDRRARPRYKHV